MTSQSPRSTVTTWKNRLQPVFAFGRGVVLTGAVVTGLVWGVRQLGGLQPLELGAYDQLLRLKPDEGPDNRLLVVGVTEEDIEIQKEWPLPDKTLSQLVGKLEAAQPIAIGLDFYRDVPIGTGREDLLKRLQSSDRTVIVCKVSSSKSPGVAPPPGLSEDHVGFADLIVDPGGTVRRSTLLLKPPDRPVREKHLCNDPQAQLLSLDLQLSLIYLGSKGIEPELTPAGEFKLGSTIFPRLDGNAGGYRNADVNGYQVMLNYRSALNSVEQVSLTDLLDGKVNPALIKDRIVLVGYTAASSKDDFYTPYSAGQADNQKMPGVTIHAQTVSQIISAVMNQRPLISFWSDWGEGIWIFGWAIAGGAIAWSVRHPARFGLATGLALGALFGISYGLFVQTIWVPLVPAGLSLLGTAGGIILADRFNKSGYGKVIYEKVKGVLKLDIEIDESKRQQQVAEITETDYFQELQKKAKELKERADHPTPSQPSTGSSAAPSETSELDYLQQLQQKAAQFKQDNTDVGSTTPPLPFSPPKIEQPATEATETSELDYLQQLQQKAQQLKQPNDQE